MAAIADLTLINKIWPQVTAQSLQNGEYVDFLSFMQGIFRQTFRWSNEQGHLIDRACAAVTLGSILDFIGILRGIPAPGATNPQIVPLINIRREDIAFRFKHLYLQSIGLPLASDAAIINSMCLAVSIWATIEVNTPTKSALRPGEEETKRAVDWEDSETLSQVISQAFPVPQTAGLAHTQFIDPKLTMEYLCKYHSFNMLWTDDLTEHLATTWGGGFGNVSTKPTIRVYRHKILLRNELEYYPTCSILPRDLLEETLDSLNLLFPYNDHATKRFLDKQQGGRSFYNLAWCGRQRVLDPSKYVRWREKISHLSEISKGSPVGFPQLLPDRDGRNVMQSVNFWTAFWVGAFTVISVAFGIVSLILAKQALDLTRLQWELSLAQACADDKSGDLAKFCA